MDNEKRFKTLAQDEVDLIADGLTITGKEFLGRNISPFDVENIFYRLLKISINCLRILLLQNW